MDYRLLGPFEVRNDAGALVPLTRGRPRAVLAYLLLHPNQVVATHRLIDALWNEDLPDRPEAALQVHVSRLRSKLGTESVIVTRPSGYLIRVAPDELDIEVAERLIQQGIRAKEENNHQLSAELLTSALGMWRGDTMGEFSYEEWAQIERRRLEDLRLLAVENLHTARIALGHHAEVVGELESLLELHPFREGLWMNLMLALYRSGRQAEAMRAYSDAADILATELGLVPSPAMQELEEHILIQDPSLLQPAKPATKDRKPLPTGTVTILVCSLEQVDGLADATQELVQDHGGHVFNRAGNRVYAAFQTADDALGAAVAIQRWGRAQEMEPRIALHTCSTQPVGEAYVGEPVTEVSAVLSAAGPGQIILTKATASSASTGHEVKARDEGDYRLPGRPAPLTLYRVIVEGVDDGATSFRAPTVPRTNLAPSLAPLVSREQEVQEVTSLLRERRLVTITGPGGVGKTRLAQAAAAEFLSLDGGVWWVDLSQVTETGSVVSAVTRTLQIDETGPDPHRDLAAGIGERAMVLVLDGCDPFIEEAVELLEAVLPPCPHLTILVTSRERLGLTPETVFPMAGLTVPPASATSLEDVSRAESARMLVERARASDPAFELNDETAPSVATICRLVDGLPLGLELAAARLDIMSVDDLAVRLRASLDVLVGRSRSLVPRHRRLSDTVDWSFRLLDDKAATLLTDLTVFEGPFVIRAAQAVTRAEDAFLDHLTELVAKSLITTSSGGRDRRFALSRPVRDHVSRSLGPDRKEELLRRHCEYYQTEAAEAAKKLRGSEGSDVLDRLELEHREFVSALVWSIENAPNAAASIAASLWRFWLQRGYVAEGRQLLEAVIDKLPSDHPRLIQLLHGKGVLAYMQGDVDAAETARAAGLELARAKENPGEVASALVFLGSLHALRGDRKGATALLDDGVRIHQEMEESQGLASAFSMLGSVGEFQSDLVELCRAGLVAFQARGDDWGTATSLWYLATVSQHDDPHQAQRWLQEAARLFLEVGDQRGLALCLAGLAMLGEVTAAGYPSIRLMALSARLRAESGTEATPVEASAFERHVRLLRDRFPEAFDAQWKAGGSLDPTAALDEVARLPPPTRGLSERRPTTLPGYRASPSWMPEPTEDDCHPTRRSQEDPPGRRF